MNPLRSIVRQLHEDDLVIVKLDIDTHHIEQPMFEQLFEDESIQKKVDHFYFEHHVPIWEYRHLWQPVWRGLNMTTDVKTAKESLDIMQGLRKKGVASHYWV